MNRTDRYFCTWPECGRSYGKPSKLAEHYRSHTNDRCFVCEHEECGKSFLRKSHLQRHQLTAHLKERPFKCQFTDCDAAFALKHHLIRHEKLHYDLKPFACTWPSCSQSFSKHEQLRRHVCIDHTGQDLFKCEQCDAGFKSKVEYKRHVKAAHSSRVYVCGVEGCGASFPKWTLVVRHRKEEHRPLPSANLMCEECGRGPFKSDASLRQHIRTHTLSPSPVKHSCPHCAKEYESRSSLKAHLTAVHSSKIPFGCSVCGKAYGYKKLLKRHMEKRHSDSDVTSAAAEDQKPEESSMFFAKERSLVCPIKECRRRFFRQYDLDRHVQSMHS